jgi:hypothetical protein
MKSPIVTCELTLLYVPLFVFMYFYLQIRGWFKNYEIQLRILLSIINKIHNICKICCSRYNCKWNIRAGLLFLQPVIHLQTIDQYTYCRFDNKNCTVFTNCIYTFPTSLILTTIIFCTEFIDWFYFNHLIHKYIYHNTISLYNVHSYLFRHLCVILKEFQQFGPR